MKNWFSVTSELLVDLAAAIIVLAVIETQLLINSEQGSMLLTLRLAVAIVFVVLAKYLRDERDKL